MTVTVANILNSRQKRIICILQNAWGDKDVPMIFHPNPHNKSCKVIRKIVGEQTKLHFCNTTSIVTPTAKGRSNTDYQHFQKVCDYINNHDYDLVIVCGKQAEEAVNKIMLDKKFRINKKIFVMCHPAYRALSNTMIQAFKAEVGTLLKN